MRKRIYDYDIKEKSFNIFLNFSFPLWFNDIKVEITAYVTLNLLFPQFYYTIATKDWIIEEILYDSEDESKINQTIKEILDILENNLFLVESNYIEFETKNSNNEYHIIFEKTKIRNDKFNYTFTIKVSENNNSFFRMILSFVDNENKSNFNNILKTLKLILKLKNLNTIKKAIKDSVKDIIIEEIENLI
jgi:hypothetical protein